MPIILCHNHIGLIRFKTVCKCKVTKWVDYKVSLKKMFNLDEEKIEYALGHKELGFRQDKKAENVVFFFFTSDVGTRGIYLSLTLVLSNPNN